MGIGSVRGINFSKKEGRYEGKIGKEGSIDYCRDSIGNDNCNGYVHQAKRERGRFWKGEDTIKEKKGNNGDRRRWRTRSVG